MSIESELYDRLRGYAGLAALVGTRIYRPHLPQNATLPAVSLFRVSTLPRSSAMGSDSGLVAARFQMDAWAEDDGDMRAVRDQVRQALQRWRDATATPEILDCFIEGEGEEFEIDSEPPTYHGIIEVLVHFRE